MIHSVSLALVTGIGGNFLYEFFNLKLDTAEHSRFSLGRMMLYVDQVQQTLLSQNRLEVAVYATLFYALILSLPVYYLRYWVSTPLYEAAGVEHSDEVLTWREYAQTMHLRIAYWISFLVDKVLIGWATWVVFLAFNPNQIVSRLKYMQNVRSPMYIMTNPQNYPGIIILFVVGAIIASAYHNGAKPHHEKYGRKGGFIRS
jgi:hypothetical protein